MKQNHKLHTANSLWISALDLRLLEDNSNCQPLKGIDLQTILLLNQMEQVFGFLEFSVHNDK